jgi:hypothetical protein
MKDLRVLRPERNCFVLESQLAMFQTGCWYQPEVPELAESVAPADTWCSKAHWGAVAARSGQ